MSPLNLARLRTVWWTLHRWIALGLSFLLVPIAQSGALLVWHDHLDAVLHPARYAVTGPQIAPPSVLLASAAAALESGVGPMAVRFPESEGWPVTVLARAVQRAEGGPPRLLTVYLDPPSGRVLDVVDFRSSLIGFLHRFHENLTVPDYSGRQIVGWAGVGMLILSLTGIWLWWPRNGAFLPGLRWRRSGATTTNLHHLFGFWISLPLAVVSFTGLYLAFPQSARSVMSSMAPMTPPAQRSIFAGQVVRETELTPDRALGAALTSHAGLRPAAIFLPTESANANRGGPSQREGRNEGVSARDNAGPSPAWRIQLRKSQDPQIVTLLVDDRTGAVQQLPDPLAGDRAAQWMRWIHEGSHSGAVWQVLVFLTGILPTALMVTGIIMWLRGRHSRRAAVIARNAATGRLQAAE
jgi:uncharacterized iron-regulated membrane protein